MKIILLIVSILLSSCISISMQPSRRADSGMGRNEVETIKSIKNNDAKWLQAKNYNVEQVLTSKALSELLYKNEKTFVLVCATWCPHSNLALSQFKNIKDSLADIGVTSILIYQTYDVKNIRNQMLKASLSTSYYLLDPTEFSLSESECFKKLTNQFVLNSPDVSLMSPYSLIINKNNKTKNKFLGGEPINFTKILNKLNE